MEILKRRQQLLVVQNGEAAQFGHHERDVREQPRIRGAQGRLDLPDGLERAGSAGEALAHRGERLRVGSKSPNLESFAGGVGFVVSRRGRHRDGIGQRARVFLGHARQQVRGVVSHRFDVRVEHGNQLRDTLTPVSRRDTSEDLLHSVTLANLLTVCEVEEAYLGVIQVQIATTFTGHRLRARETGLGSRERSSFTIFTALDEEPGVCVGSLEKVGDFLLVRAGVERSRLTANSVDVLDTRRRDWIFVVAGAALRIVLLASVEIIEKPGVIERKFELRICMQ